LEHAHLLKMQSFWWYKVKETPILVCVIKRRYWPRSEELVYMKNISEFQMFWVVNDFLLVLNAYGHKYI
jgi:hypothetical protein